MAQNRQGSGDGVEEPDGGEEAEEEGVEGEKVCLFMTYCVTFLGLRWSNSTC